MKKLIAFFLCFVMVLPAMAQEADVLSLPIDNTNAWVQAFPLQGGLVLCVDNGDSFFFLNADGTELIALKARKITAEELGQKDDWLQWVDFVEDDDKAYAIIIVNPHIFAVPVRFSSNTLEFGQAVPLDCEHRIEYYDEPSSNKQYASLYPGNRYVLAGNTLYVSQYGQEGDIELDSFNILTGEYTPCAANNLLSIAPHKDGKLILIQTNDADTPAPMSAFIFNPTDESTEKFADFDHHDTSLHLLYEKATDSLLYADGMRIYRLGKNGVKELCGYFPDKNIELFLLDSGKLAGLNGQTIRFVATDGSAFPTDSLRLYRVNNDEEVRTLMNEVIFTDLKGYQDNVALGQALVSGSLMADVLSLNSNQNAPEQLIQKGYLADLHDVPGVQEYMASLYPFLSEPFIKDGAIYAIPVFIDSNNLGYFHSVFQKLGYTVPETFRDFCDIISDFHENHSEDTSVCLMDSPITAPWLFRQMANLYLNTRLQMGLPLTLDTPEFRQMVAAFDTLPEQYRQKSSSDEEHWLDTGEQQPLFFQYTPSSPFDITYVLTELKMEREETYSCLPLMLSAWEGAPKINTSFTKYLCVFAQSPNMENAKKYIRYTLQKMDAQFLATVVKSYDEPIESESFQGTLKVMNDRLIALKEEIAKAEGAQKTQLENDYQIYQNGMELFEKNCRYAISPEGLKYYQEKVMAAPVLDIAHPLIGRKSPLDELIDRYFGGQISIDQLIKEFDQKARLITLEQQ